MQDHWTNCWPFGMRHNYVTVLERPISNPTSSTHTILTPWTRRRNKKKMIDTYFMRYQWHVKASKLICHSKIPMKKTRIFAWDDSYAFSIRIWFHSFWLECVPQNFCIFFSSIAHIYRRYFEIDEAYLFLSGCSICIHIYMNFWLSDHHQIYAIMQMMCCVSKNRKRPIKIA